MRIKSNLAFRLRTTLACLAAALTVTVALSGTSAYLGTIPEYGTTADGVSLAGVAEGSPAARAGLRQGDVIIRLGPKTIQDIEDLTKALGQQSAGDEVEIVVRRAGGSLTFKAVLGSRG